MALIIISCLWGCWAWTSLDRSSINSNLSLWSVRLISWRRLFVCGYSISRVLRHWYRYLVCWFNGERCVFLIRVLSTLAKSVLVTGKVRGTILDFCRQIEMSSATLVPSMVPLMSWRNVLFDSDRTSILMRVLKNAAKIIVCLILIDFWLCMLLMLRGFFCKLAKHSCHPNEIWINLNKFKSCR